MERYILIAARSLGTPKNRTDNHSNLYTNMAASGKLHNFVHMMKTFYSPGDLDIFLFNKNKSASLERRYFAILTKDFIMQV